MSRLGHAETIPSLAPDMDRLRLCDLGVSVVKIRAKQRQKAVVGRQWPVVGGRNKAKSQWSVVG
jgi:hypothetical protein